MGSGFRTFQSGEVLTAANVQDYLMDQSVQVFAGTAALGSAIGTAVEPGMVAYLTDSDQIIHYRADAVQGTAWQAMPMVGGAANVIINGAMQVAQRGTSVTGVTNGAYRTVDRFIFSPSSMGTWTETVENDAPTGSGLRKSLKVLCTTADASPAANDEVMLDCKLEGQNLQQFLKGTSSAKQFALSFWVKSNTTGTYIVWLLDNDNTRCVSASYTISASGTWEKKTIIFPADTTGAFDNDNGDSLLMRMYLGAGSTYTSGTLATTWATAVAANRAVGQTNLAAATNNYWQVTGIQLEAGSVATPFEFEDYSTTLNKCRRYFYSSFTASVGTAESGASRFRAATTSGATFAIDFQVLFPVRMRTTPTVTWYSTSGAAGKVRITSADVNVDAAYDARDSHSGYPLLASAPAEGDDCAANLTASAEM